MSNLIHCDGPGCEETKDPAAPDRLCDPGWITTDATGVRLDFHHAKCLGTWALQQPGTGPTIVVDGQ